MTRSDPADGTRAALQTTPDIPSSSAPRVALFGGSFNPPHMAHVLVAVWALATDEVDEVWIIPTGGHPFGKSLEAFDHRLAMCRLAFGFSSRVRVTDVEREPRVHYTVETLRRLCALYPNHRWRWLMGSDTVAKTPNWRQFDEIEKLAPPLTIPRDGHGHGAGPNGAFALPDLSSTMIREHLVSGGAPGELDGLVPGAVLRYIEAHGLYRPGATG